MLCRPAMSEAASPSPASTTASDKTCLVTGGSGFLGRHVVEYLLQKGFKVRVFDVVQSFQDSRVDKFVVGDVRQYHHLLRALNDVDIVFHIAAVGPSSTTKELFEVNVDGTSNVLKAARETNVTRFIYTSSATVVLDGADIKNGDESLPYPAVFINDYAESKALAEKLVLSYNGLLNSKGQPMLSTSLRPHNLFGPRDPHFLTQLLNQARCGHLTHMVGVHRWCWRDGNLLQIGDGTNIVSWTYVENAVFAHALAADHLVPGSGVDGQVYFITNGEPRRLWEFIFTLLRKLGCVGPRRSISYSLAYGIATLMDSIRHLFGWMSDFRPSITCATVSMLSNHCWFTYDKALRDFGYTPIVPLAVGIERTVEYFSWQERSVTVHERTADDDIGSEFDEDEQSNDELEDLRRTNARFA